MSLDLMILATIIPAVIVIIAIVSRHKDSRHPPAGDGKRNDSPGSHLG